jgi:hypothetical protein
MKPTRVTVRVDGGVMTVEIDGNGRRQRVRYRSDYMLPFTRTAGAPHVLELFEFMLALYAADRLVPRPARGWTRTLHVTFPVSRLAQWSIARASIEELIWSATGDVVVLNPVQRPRGSLHVDARNAHLELEHQTRTSVVLLSDGLDSLCGAFGALDEPADRVAFVSLVTNSRKARRIATIVDGLKARYGTRADFHRVRDLHLVAPPRAQEGTQRTRTLLAIAAGLTVAAAYGSPRTSVSENGMGILNLPVPSVQTRHESSQVLHPQNLRLWSRVSELLIGGAELFYPNRFRTKAQMIADVPVGAYDLIWATSSCDAPQRGDANDACGVCGSCAYRKFALFTAGIPDRSRYALWPPLGGPYDPMDLLRMQAVRMRAALASSDPWRALVRLQPTLRTSIDDVSDGRGRDHAIASTVALLRRHVDETDVRGRLARAV